MGYKKCFISRAMVLNLYWVTGPFKSQKNVMDHLPRKGTLLFNSAYHFRSFTKFLNPWTLGYELLLSGDKELICRRQTWSNSGSCLASIYLNNFSQQLTKTWKSCRTHSAFLKELFSAFVLFLIAWKGSCQEKSRWRIINRPAKTGLRNAKHAL